MLAREGTGARGTQTHHTVDKLVLPLVLCNFPPLMESGNQSRSEQHQSSEIGVIRDLAEYLRRGKDSGDHLWQVFSTDNDGVDAVRCQERCQWIVHRDRVDAEAG